jgi:phosphatidylglycerol lysyltransferase
MKQQRTPDIGPLLGVLLLAVVLWALQYELRAPHSHDLAQPVIPIPRIGLLFALFLTALSSLALTSPTAFTVPFRRPISLLLFRHVFRSGAVRGSALVHRVRSSLQPLVGALLLLGGYGVVQRTGQFSNLTRVGHDLHQWLLALAPYLLAFSTFLDGAILFFSDETLSVISLWPWLTHLVPLSGLAMSPFFGSVVALALLPVAYGLHQRIDAAYFLAASLLGAGAFFSLFSGFAYTQAASLSLVLVIASRCRERFYRTASLVIERFTARWIASISFVILGLLWLGMFTSTHNVYAHQTWWQFVMNEAAPLAP